MQVPNGSADTPATPEVPETGAVAGKRYNLKETAALIKKRLSQLYPAVKFSVRSENFSMGDAIRVAWVDGPTEAALKPFLDQFKAGSYDSLAESYEYRLNCPFEGKYISTRRDYSARYCATAVRNLDLCTPPPVEAQLKEVGEAQQRGWYQAGRSYGLRADNGHYLFTVAPAHEMEAWTRQQLESSLRAQGYEVEAGDEAGEYVLAAYATRA